LKNLNVGDQPDPFGNKAVDGVKVFDHEANRFGHSNEAIQFPNLFHQDHEDPRSHPLHQTLVDHGYSYSHTTPVSQRDGSTHNHHQWVHRSGHLIGAYAGDTKWSAKVSSPSGHTWEGIGTKALEKHLTNKAKRYRNESQALPQTDILENLLSGHDKVNRYAAWMA